MANTYDNDITVYTYLDTSDDTSPSGWTEVSATLGEHNTPDGGGFITVSTDGNIFGGSFAGTSGEIVKYNGSWSGITPGYLFDDDDDHAQVLPLSGGDILLLYEDSTANTLYSAVYDEATDTWDGSATSVTTITSGTTSGVEDANWGAVSDGSNNTYLVLNNDILASTGDLECWFFNDTSRSWTQKTNILTDSNGAEVKPAYDLLGDTLFAVYIIGNDVFVKNSTDGGTTWNSAQEVTTTSMGWVVIRTNFISDERIYVIYIEYSGGANLDDAYGNTIADMEVVTNYELDLEVQWTNVDYDKPSEELCVYGGTIGAENITVDAWNGSDWENVFTYMNSGWNNVSVTSYLTSSNFTIRFKGSSETGDTTQNTWNIDAVLLHVGPELSGEADFNYVLKLVEVEGSDWKVRLKAYDNSSLSRLDNCSIYIYDGFNSTQIIILNGAYNQQTGPWYDLNASDTEYIWMHVETSSAGTSTVYVYLEIRVPNKTVYARYVILFEIN